MKFISVSGGYWTGSGAVIDLLQEHDSCLVVDGEFSLFSFGQLFQEITSKILAGEGLEVNKLKDCLYRFNEFNKSDYPLGVRSFIRRFVSLFELYYRPLCSTRMNAGLNFGEEYVSYCKQFEEEIFNYHYNADLNSNVRVKFLTEQILISLLSYISQTSKNGKIGVFDQFVGPGYALDALKILPNMKFIFVDRDWRDQYIEIRSLLSPMLKKNNSVGLKPLSEDLDDHKLNSYDYFIKLRKKLKKIREFHEKNCFNSILWIDFEDLVKVPQETAYKIFEFIELNSCGWSPNKYFHPNVSIKNIGKWKSNKYMSEIKYLEKYI